MKLVASVAVDGDTATAAGALFEDWAAAEPVRTVVTRLTPVEKPPAGEPWRRGLPALLQLVREQVPPPELVVLDGAVHLDPQDTPGLGRALFDALGGTIPVLGISKSAMKPPVAQFEVAREDEAPPVTVTAAGLDLGAAKARVRTMHGRKRVPTLVKWVDRVARGKVAP